MVFTLHPIPMDGTPHTQPMDHQGASPNMHPPPPGPPGLPRPPMRHPVRTAPPTPPTQPHNTANGASEGSALLKIDEFWRGRLAPLPGTSSPLSLLSVSKAIEIKRPLTKEERRKNRKDTSAPKAPSANANASASADAVNSPDSASKSGEISVMDASSPSDTDENNVRRSALVFCQK